MSTSLHDFVVESLRARREPLRDVAKATGVPLATLRKIAGREIEQPRIGHVETLLEHFKPGAISRLLGGNA